MKESTLLKISLIFSIVGILILIVISQTYKISLFDIGSINNGHIDKNVRVIGTVDSIKEYPGLVIINIKDGKNSITVVVFNQENITLKKEEKIEVSGIVKEYNGKLEIEAKEIKVL